MDGGNERAQESVERLHGLAIEYASALGVDDTHSRVESAKIAEKTDDFEVFRGEMERYLLVA